MDNEKAMVTALNDQQFIDTLYNLAMVGGRGLAINSNGELNINALRTNALLQKDDWKMLDGAVVEVARGVMNGIEDLRRLGLTFDVGGLGTTILEYEQMSDMSDANVDMAAVTPGQEDTVAYSTTGVPIPIIHKDYRLNIRRLMAARKNGHPIETHHAETAAMKVTEKLEDILFNGITMKADGYNVYGYTTFPQRLRTNIATPWDSATTSILTDVEHMIATMEAAYHRGPLFLYVPTNYYSILIKDWSTYKEGTFLDRILAYPQIAAVRQSSKLLPAEVVMVEMKRGVVDLVIGQDITNVEWTSRGGLQQHNVIMTAAVPRFKYDDNGNCGILHAFEAATSTTTTAA